MPMRFAGELSALGTAVCWAAGSNLFTAAGRRMGSANLNRLRVVAAMVLLCLGLWVVAGSPWPTWASRRQVALLAASGLVGYAIGDSFSFRSLVILGPGRAALVSSSTPIFALLIAYPVLGELPGPLALVGIALTLGGIAWVLRERSRHAVVDVEGSAAVGVMAGTLGALGQAGGYILSKLALRDGLDPLPATVIRIVAATAALWLWTALRGQVGTTLNALRDRRAALFMAGGAVFGPFLGVTLSLAALLYVDAGIAASLIATSPILAMMIASRAHGEPLSWRSLAGALVAVAGVVVLFLR